MSVSGPAALLLRCSGPFVIVLAAMACGEPAPATDAPAETVAEDTATADVTAAIRPVAALPARSQRITTFPHEPHFEVACGVCHTRVPGHDGHATLGCTECHEAASPDPRRVVTAETCQACHHGNTQGRTCADCHPAAPAGARAVPVSVRVAGREPLATRALPFEHERHETVACAQCHTGPAPMATPRPCTACHADHHVSAARCLTCHSPPASAHGLGAHRTCGGAGCHTDVVVLRLTQSRQVCLVCHAGQEDHETGQECSKCHLSAGQALAGRPAVESRE